MRSISRLRHRRAEDGFTVVEVMITSVLLLVVTTMIFEGMISLQRAGHRVQALVNNEQDVRFVVTQMVRDIRAANPLVAFSGTATDYKTRAEMMIGPANGTQQRVRWVYDTTVGSPTYQTLRRQVVSADGATVLSSITRLSHVRNNVRTPAVDVFNYVSQSGTDLVVAGNGNDVGNCAINVEVVITADSNPGPEPFTVRSNAELRNRLPGGVGCG